MLERGKFCSSAAIATALAVSGGNRSNSDNAATKLSLQLPNERYAYNLNNLYATPRIDVHEIEWTEADSIETDVPRFVASSSTGTTVTTRNNPRKCCRTSTSSGYSSHSSPLSAGSYSCYSSAIPGQNFFRNVPLSMKDQFCGGLAIIHETETIPRPIWPTVFPNARELCQNDENPEYDSLYACCECGCAYTYSYCDWDHEKSTHSSAQDVLLELSQTLNSVIEGKNTMTPEEVLYNITHKVSQGIGLKGGLCEYVYHNSTLVPGKKPFLNDKNLSFLSCDKNTSSSMNPVNSKLYNNVRHFYMHNPAWYNCLYDSERKYKFLSSLKSDEQNETNVVPTKKENGPVVLLLDDQYQNMISDQPLQKQANVSEIHACKCIDRTSASQDRRVQNVYVDHHIMWDTKARLNVDETTERNQKNVISSDAEYTMQFECSVDDSLNKGISYASSNKNWAYRLQGFAGDLDFTLDVSRAERLGRAIAKAKRKRQWCRILTAFFGLVFFVLSVVIVSLSVTRGKKIFGSM